LPKPVVFTGGTFDLFHNGHAEFLRLCKSFGQTLVVLVSNDRRVKDRKGSSRPVIGEKDRLKLVSYLKFVDYAFLGGSLRCEDKKLCAAVKADILVLSDENKQEKMAYLKKSFSKEGLAKEIKVKFVPAKFYSASLSTTRLIESIKNGTVWRSDIKEKFIKRGSSSHIGNEKRA